MKKLIIFIAAAIIAIGAAIAVFIVVQRPSKSTVRQNQDQTATDQTEIQKTKTIETAYFIVTIPASFEVKTNTESNNTQNMLQIVAMQPHASGQQIAVTVGVLTGGGLADIASYNLRIKNPSTYNTVEFGGMPAGAPTFYSATGADYEITTFWPRASLVATISVSGNSDSKTEINQALMQVLGSWQWR
jgi:hypothetical protein